MKELEEIFARLGLDENNGLFITKDNLWKKETSFPNRVKRLIDREIKPYAFFCFDNKPLILFFHNPVNKKGLHKAIWNFNECPIVIIIENDVVEIFNGFRLEEDTKLLKQLGGVDKLNEFSYFELVMGKTWEDYKEELHYKNRVDYHLLENIKAVRTFLVEKQGLDATITNGLIGKIIFTRYLIDRKVKMKFDGNLRTWSNEEFCELLVHPSKVQKFFDYLEDKERGFNGDLFPLTKNEYEQISNEDYLVIKRLLKGEDIGDGQLSLFELYDFSIIPIEFISNVYELFIGQDNQKSAGAYYTPLFLVDYILTETVEKKLNQEGAGYDCKVLDPACGSGIFLVETLRKVIEKYISNTKIDKNPNEFKEVLQNLAKENIFGIDKDLSAVQVAVFSIYLTLLDYLDPPEIETFKFPELLKTNFFHADFFDENSSFNERLKDIEFDFILGNPPWNRGKGEKVKPLYVKYIDKRREKERKKDGPPIDIGNREIAQAFLLRTSDFSKERTKGTLIVTSKTLYNLQSASFRKYFLNNFFIEKVFELAPVRRQVFDKSNDKAIAPACVLFFNYANGSDTDLNIIEHIALKPSRFFSLFKIFTINRTDFKKVQQNKLKEYDWLWKVLVYGSYLDFNFLKRLNSEYYKIKDIVAQEGILFKQGLKRKDGNRKISVHELVEKPFLNTRKGDLTPFHIVDSGEKWKIDNVGYIYKQDGRPYIELFKPYSLLIAGGISSDFTSNAAVNKEERVFTSSIRALKIFDNNQLPILYSINSILCSSLFSYYMLCIGASAAIEREESEDEEIENMWYFQLDNIIQETSKIESAIRSRSEMVLETIPSQPIKSYTDPLIFSKLNLSELETVLIDYATKIAIPIAMKNDGYKRLLKHVLFMDDALNNYASLFIDRFKSKLDTKDKKFTVEIWHTNQIIGMFFRMVDIIDFKQEITWINKQNNAVFLSFLTNIGSKKITDRLFVQKDIRNFDNNRSAFFIIKPNERRLWHKAIGYLDVNEFADSMLKAGREGI